MSRLLRQSKVPQRMGATAKGVARKLPPPTKRHAVKVQCLAAHHIPLSAEDLARFQLVLDAGFCIYDLLRGFLMSEADGRKLDLLELAAIEHDLHPCDDCGHYKRSYDLVNIGDLRGSLDVLEGWVCKDCYKWPSILKKYNEENEEKEVEENE